MFDQIIKALPTTAAQGFGVFLFMVSEAILGKTRFGSWLGLAQAIVWFILKTIFGGVARVVLAALKFKSGQAAQKEGSNGKSNEGS